MLERRRGGCVGPLLVICAGLLRGEGVVCWVVGGARGGRLRGAEGSGTDGMLVVSSGESSLIVPEMSGRGCRADGGREGVVYAGVPSLLVVGVSGTVQGNSACQQWL